MAVYSIDGFELTTTYNMNDASSLKDVYDMSGMRIGMAGSSGIFKDVAEARLIGSISASGIKQGGATDGTYIYQTSGDTSDAATYMNLVKFKISDGTSTVVHYDGTPSFGHANDVIYNPNTGYLYITTQTEDGRLNVVNASDLSYVDTIYVEDEQGLTNRKTWQGCYDRTRNCFYLTLSDRIYTYDENWNYIGRTTKGFGDPHSNTHQGADTDGVYYYRLTYNPNYLLVYTLDATLVGDILLPIPGEPEAVMCDWNGKFYVTTNVGSNNVYEIEIFNEQAE